ncbi:hypothetical protein CU669_11175 [Paramagnetospirillum kuznetsovii]|uniref:Glycosyltransferase subfamily 4-like N-terminal domain-containing protein n=1 Tax=Paramagnetospirillum kuznetsovii TaxID=2053833 RepID=A0A364NXQ5_9PROT|nr:glycosyltransferase [Paramagnetospirillum kuznetsovii]RAU21859.1 hypothetical protein CU669_11175 [Paramagnetospirillum kuznetsovii]
MNIALLSFSAIPDDARVRRHGDALMAAGHDVIAIGLPGGRAMAPSWALKEIAPIAPEGALRPLLRAWRIGRMALCRMVPGLADAIYWGQAQHRAMYDAASVLDADVFVANDWLTLPIASRLAAERGKPYLYDSHEYAVEEGADRRLWRLLVSPYVRAMEARHIHGAAVVMTVADGIARLMRRDHGLLVDPVVVRNVVPSNLQPFRPCGAVIDVLYQGLLRADRGLDTLIRSVPAWRPEFRLRIRGPGEPAVVERLKIQAMAAAPDRIVFDPPVSPLDMIAAANRSDLGIHPIPPTSNQTRYCLPNKFFEYAMAGLALCVSDSVEMSALMRLHGLGEVITADTTEAIARAVNSFDRDRIDACKRNAIEAARQLSWERESVKLVMAFEQLRTGY